MARLPFLQVPQEELDRAHHLGAVLGLPWSYALGIAIACEAHALARATHADASGRICDPEPERVLAGVVAWAGDPKVLLDGLLRAGVVRVCEQGCIYVLGLDKYAKALEKVSGRSGAASKAAKRRWELERARKAGDATRIADASPRHAQTQTNTQKQREATTSPLPPPGGQGERRVQPALAAYTATAETFAPPPEPEDGPKRWDIPAAVDAVHREVQEGRPYPWHHVADEQAATALLSLCAAEKIPIHLAPEEVGRRFGRALVRSFDRYAKGKAVTLRELARRECWLANAEPVTRQQEVRDALGGQARTVTVKVEPWDAVAARGVP